MDPVSLALIAAIGAGVTSSVTDATKASLVAGYTALKTRLLEKISSLHPKVPLALAELEAAPTSQARQAVLVEEVSATPIPHDAEFLDLAHALLQQIQQTPTGSQIIYHVENSAVSNSGTANTYNIQGDQHVHYETAPKPWMPPLMLPPRAQSFVGREEDLAWLLPQLMGEEGVTLALCGPGGMGKTALAAEALRRLTSQEDWSVRFPDGIFYHSFYTYRSLVVAFEDLVRFFGEEPGDDPSRATRAASVNPCSRWTGLEA